MTELGIDGTEGIEIANAKISDHNDDYIKFLYQKLQRKGMMERDCQRMVNLDRNVFAACMVVNGHADALVTGMTRPFTKSFEHVTRVIDPNQGTEFCTTSMLISKGRTVFIGDTSIHERPTAEQMADIAIAIASKARTMGYSPRVAFSIFFQFRTAFIKHHQTSA